tara:strand:- start:72 stop:287 length:216 start_codon:yes stop_codon:yes gene_type:complete
MKRIKKNDLLPWFTQDHGTLPASYLRSCEKFFKSLKPRYTPTGILLGVDLGDKPQASSSKQQATSHKLDKK